MKQVEASAKTREEAIQNALKDLGVEMYEVDKIEVLDEGSKGLFGFGSRPVKVRLVVENMPDEPLREQTNEGRGGRNNRGRGNRDQNREARTERPKRNDNREARGNETTGRAEQGGESGERKERNGERDGRGGGRDGKPRNERGNRNRNRRPENSNDGTAAAGTDKNEKPSQGRGSNEVNPSRGARERNRGGRNASAPRTEENTAPVEGAELQEDGITADAIEPITDAQGTEAATLLEEIITKMGIEAKAEFTRSEDGSARLNVSSEDSAILIGRKGRNLSAMQYLVNRMISRGDTNENTERLVVDVEGYVDRRRETLHDMAKSMAERAKESQRNMRLKPLSPQERRIVHLALQDDEDIRTFSLGESLYRSVVISPKGAAQPERGRNNRGGRGGRGGRRRGGRDRSGEGRSGEGRSAEGRSGRKPGTEKDADVGTFGD